MIKVRWNPAGAAAILCLLIAACASNELPANLPVIFPEETAPREKREPQVPEGFLGDPATGYFHRVKCPQCEEIDPRHRLFFPHPYDALNEGLAPCEHCEPMVGWQ